MVWLEVEVHQSSSQSVEDHTVRCVVESEGSTHGYNFHRYDTIDSIYFDGVAIVLDNTSGHLLLGERKIAPEVLIMYARVIRYTNPTICWRRLFL